MGFFSKVKKGLKKVGKAVRSGITQIVDVVKEAVHRVFGVVDFLANLIGINLPKNLRLRVILLKDDAGSFMNTEADVEPAIERARAIFKAELSTRIVAAGGRMIDRAGLIPPPDALRPSCDFGAWKEEFGDAGHFFFLYTVRNWVSGLTGYATPITAFIVDDVQDGKVGCSLGPLTDYVTLDQTGIATITVGSPSDDVSATIGSIWLAHEIAHCCGLWHLKKKINLMHESEESGINLRKWQKAIARNSRHISFF